MSKTKKQILGEVEEKIDAMGQEDEKKAASAVKEVHKENEADDKKFETQQLDKLSVKSRFSFLNYKHTLSEALAEIVKRREICPRGWHYYSFYNDDGVGLFIWNDKKEKFVRAFKPVNLPDVDLNACGVLAVQAENLIGKKLREQSQTKNGILLPN